MSSSFPPQRDDRSALPKWPTPVLLPLLLWHGPKARPPWAPTPPWVPATHLLSVRHKHTSSLTLWVIIPTCASSVILIVELECDHIYSSFDLSMLHPRIYSFIGAIARLYVLHRTNRILFQSDEKWFHMTQFLLKWETEAEISHKISPRLGDDSISCMLAVKQRYIRGQRLKAAKLLNSTNK